MNKLIFLAALAMGLNATALDVFSEEDVAKQEKADKVIAVSKNALKPIIEKTRCKDIMVSRAARAYVVKKDDEASLYMTPEKLKDLTYCDKL